jgi:hypothetical protein
MVERVSKVEISFFITVEGGGVGRSGDGSLQR